MLTAVPLAALMIIAYVPSGWDAMAARIFEEVKQRPRFIRRALLRDGEKRDL